MTVSLNLSDYTSKISSSSELKVLADNLCPEREFVDNDFYSPFFIAVEEVSPLDGSCQYIVYKSNQKTIPVKASIAELFKCIESCTNLRLEAKQIPTYQNELDSKKNEEARTKESIEEAQEVLKNLRLTSQDRLKEYELKNPCPSYNLKLAVTQSSRQRRSFLTNCTIAGVLGASIFLSGLKSENGFFTMLGGVTTGVAVAAAVNNANKKLDDSDEAEEARLIQQKAHAIKSDREQLEKTIKDEISSQTEKVNSLKIKRERLASEQVKLQQKIQKAEVIARANQALGDTICFMDGEQQRNLAIVVQNLQRQTEIEQLQQKENLKKAGAGVAALTAAFLLGGELGEDTININIIE